MFITPDITLNDLKNAVIRLSDYFIENPKLETPWDKSYCQWAYKHYFLPLNYLRNELVIRRGQEVNFFKDLHTVIDWGAGPGTASFALSKLPEFQNFNLVEKSKQVTDLFIDLQKQNLNNLRHFKHLSDISGKTDPLKTLLVLSYSFTELEKLPKEISQYEALMILEPSTRDDGRRLLHIRQDLIDKGFSIWAPCTHQGPCPLLNQSQHDWCHDRVHVQGPDWFKKLDEMLPFKNRTITTSYLLARKTPNPKSYQGLARLVGDSLEEKGKTKQLLCRGSEREFLTWMHKEIQPETLSRGDLIELPAHLEKKSNELRVKKE